jgi:alpha-galactosidase
MAKIAFIGAGSVVFAKTLICDILQNKALETSTICLMDVDPARLKVAEILARKVVEQLGVKAKVQATLDLKKACTGARYVITTIQVGGYKPATVTDFEIPKKYGLRQTIADTLGVGGVFRALRTMPELVKVGNALRDFGAEDPLYLNLRGCFRLRGVISRSFGIWRIP